MALNITSFISFIGAILLVILYSFDPIKVSFKDSTNVAELEVYNFVMYELNKEALQSVSAGQSGSKFNDRVEAKKIDFTSNGDGNLQNIVADRAVYDYKLLKLEKNVNYIREDGTLFNSETLFYDKKENLIYTKSDFSSEKGKNSVNGLNLAYNIKTTQLTAKNIVAKFDIKD
ncbi:MAG: hypothetical protein GQ570_02415 [Helicobacteraceae bacterium]|nr:hypothetical protein [Helicobacteraceae bacterium]